MAKIIHFIDHIYKHRVNLHLPQPLKKSLPALYASEVPPFHYSVLNFTKAVHN